ncbi:MAG: BamA/TamA family outer membrane protein, partial [Arsenophonus sp. ER-EMS1-MAG3]
TYNNLNHSFLPTKGNKTSINSKITVPGSNNQYYKILFNSLAKLVNRIENIYYLTFLITKSVMFFSFDSSFT